MREDLDLTSLNQKLECNQLDRKRTQEESAFVFMFVQMKATVDSDIGSM